MHWSFTSLLTPIVTCADWGRYVEDTGIGCEQHVDTTFSKSTKLKLSTCAPSYPQNRYTYPHRYVEPVDSVIRQNTIYMTEKLVLL